MLAQEAKEAYRQGTERYQSQYWNSVKIFMLVFFVTSGVFWLIGYFMNVVGQDSWKIPVEAVFSDKSVTGSAYRFVLLSNVFFSLAIWSRRFFTPRISFKSAPCWVLCSYPLLA